MRRSKFSVAQGVSVAFLDAEWTPDAMTRSAKRLFRSKPDWILPIAKNCIVRFGQPPSFKDLVKFIASNAEFRSTVKLRNIKPPSEKMIARVLQQRPLVSLDWRVPIIRDYGELADWLEISRRELSWLANLTPPSPSPKHRPPQHYVSYLVGKRSSGSRLIESPKAKLKRIQKKIQSELLSRVSAHESAHGFCKGRSVISYVDPHVKKPFCLKLDLKDFFPSIGFGRVAGMFGCIGYSKEVARYLAAICTNSINAESMFLATGCPDDTSPLARLYRVRHLPQGAPTSPTAANLIAYRLDCRLAGLAASASASYTRYADDLLFSGGTELARAAKRFVISVGAITIEEGFEVQFRKTRLMRSSQRQAATGIVINERVNLARSDFDQLKAILFNCARHGAETQNLNGMANFRSHLEGRIEWARQLNEVKADKLQTLFDQVSW